VVSRTGIRWSHPYCLTRRLRRSTPYDTVNLAREICRLRQEHRTAKKLQSETGMICSKGALRLLRLVFLLLDANA
jgi:hypothetical protein